MPMFMTAMFDVAEFAARRAPRTSGQRLLPSVTEPRPSVMESPSVTTALLELSASTSTPVMIYQWAVAAAPDKLAAETTLLATINEVVREPGCPVIVVAEMLPK